MSLSKTYNCLIVDDEPPAREVLRRYIEQIPMLALAGECSNALQAVTALSAQSIDLLFLDIHMPQISGIDLIPTLKNPPNIILTTAYEDYAVKAFEFDVADYLLKPVRFERFLKAVMKALPGQEAPANNPPSRSGPGEMPASFLYFRVDRKMVKVLLNEILYIESLKDYVKICTTRNTVITRQSMAGLEAMLPAELFLRVHRSFFVALAKVDTYTQEEIGIQNDVVPIGKLYRLQVMKALSAAKGLSG